MSHNPMYIEPEFQTSPLPAIAAGKTGRPEIVPHGGVKSIGKIVFTNNFARDETVTINGVTFTCKDGTAAVGKIVFTGNLIAGDTVTINGVVFTCMASGAAGEVQFNVDSTLSLSLDALVIALNACTDPLVSIATYSKTDTNTALTVTFDDENSANNSVVIASNHSTVVVTQPNGGFDVAAGELEFNVGVSLSASLDALVSQANSCTNPLVSYATYTKTDTNSAITSTSDTYAYANNSVVLSSNHVTSTVTAPTGGKDRPNISLDTENSEITVASGTEYFVLPDGDPFQKKSIWMNGAGTAIIAGNYLTSGVSMSMTEDEIAILQWIGDEWKTIVCSADIS